MDANCNTQLAQKWLKRCQQRLLGRRIVLVYDSWLPHNVGFRNTVTTMTMDVVVTRFVLSHDDDELVVVVTCVLLMYLFIQD
jgi:hypothetical protein